ncbi:MAG: EamA family transporter RarD, partial [Duodenibacillus sp.]|nr:EamA family transporter RarD [Duodenibacillus sp.]
KTMLAFACSSVLIAANWGTFVYAVVIGRTLEASLAYFINPLMSVALGSLALKERLRPAQKLAVFIAALAVAWLAVAAGQVPWLGLAMAATFALYGLIRKVAPLGSLEGLALETLLLAPAALGYLAWLQAQGEMAFANAALGMQCYIAAAGPITAAPLLLFASAVRRIAYSTAGIIQYVSPTLQFAIGVFLFKEPFSQSMLAGFAVIWTAVAIFTADSLLFARSARRKLAGG